MKLIRRRALGSHSRARAWCAQALWSHLAPPPALVLDPECPSGRFELQACISCDTQVNNVDVTASAHHEVVELIRLHPHRVRLLVALA
jgi:hypothetical protein